MSIIIFSQQYAESSTENVIDWILTLNPTERILRINGENVLETVAENEIDEKNIRCWYRRSYNSSEHTVASRDLPKNSYDINIFMRREYIDLYLYHIGEIIDSATFCLSSPKNSKLNKLSTLKLANKCGIKTPKWVILDTPSELVRIFNGYILTKPISDLFKISKGNYYYAPFTKKIEVQELVELLPEKVFPSFFQEYIEKDFEIRSVRLIDEFYSMAIFSSHDSKTEEDFRRYNYKKSNRMIPFDLPLEIEKKLELLCNKLNLNFCSIDLLFSKGEYYFLEINPVGQFGMTSKPCNYQIEKKIAQILIDSE